MSLMNVTAVSKGTVVDGTMLSGEMLVQVTSHADFTWTVFDNFTFRHFSKPIAVRRYAWSAGPYVVFRNCVFEDSSSDLFVMKGGTLIFENCVFRNVSGRPLKGLGEFVADFVDCLFDDCGSLFLSESGASFVNCRFRKMRGKRGGAIYASKSTLRVERCMFVDCHAEVSGGAIYLRDSREHLETEIRTSCFIRTTAAVNGSAIYIYQSHAVLCDNCFPSEDSLMHVNSTVQNDAPTYDSTCAACTTLPPAPYLPIDYTPTDTHKWYQLDDLKSGATIILDDL